MLTVVCAPKFIDSKYSEDSFALFEGDLCVGHVLRTSQVTGGQTLVLDDLYARRVSHA